MRKWLFLMVPFFTATATAQENTVVRTISNASDKVFRSPDVDSKPQLKNGLNELSAFIGNHYKFPEIKKKQVKIFVSFIVEPDGSTSDAKAFYISIKDLVAAGEQAKTETDEQKAANLRQADVLKNEAVRVIKAFDVKWIPAKKDGKFVRCLYNYPINFNIE